MTLIHNGMAALPYHHYIGLRGFPMNGSELSERLAKALLDIQDATNLIVLDMLEGRECAGSATRFAAIRQYAMRALDDLSTSPDGDMLSMPQDQASKLLHRRRVIESGLSGTGLIEPGDPLLGRCAP
jgi:hypothetical protein